MSIAESPPNPTVRPVNPTVRPVNPAVRPVNPAVRPVNPAVRPVNPAVGPEEAEFPLLRVIDALRLDERRIEEKVSSRRQRLAKETGLSGLALTDALVDELIFDAKLRSALIGAGFALPWSIPVVGPWGTLALTLLGALIWQTANEVELVYELAYAYQTRMNPQRLRLTAFWIVQLTNYDELRERALSTGVTLTVRKLVEKLLAVGLARASAATAHAFALTPRLGSKPPWFVRATEYLGVPVLFCLGWRSTGAVGRRAVAFFRDEAGTERLALQPAG